MPFEMVFPLRAADGTLHPFLTRGMPVRDGDGKVTRWVGTNTDITEQRKIEEALATSESRLRALLESASEGVVAIDESGRITLVNAKTEELFGYSRDELLGQPLGIMLPERYRSAHAAHERNYFADPRTKSKSVGLDLWGRKKDGTEVPLEVSLSAVEQGGSHLALALITDITERKYAEERQRQAQKLESLGLLAGGVAHDFNNLLVGVIGNASLAQNFLRPGHPASELLERIIRSGEQAAHLTRQMLAYAGKGRFLIEPINLSQLIPEISGLVQPAIPKKIRAQLALAPDLPLIEADRGQIQQVFMNLVLNAAEAIGDQTGLITVTTGVQDIDDFDGLASGQYVFLEVRDTGCGMDDEIKARIFDPFFSTKFTGRGLGLAAVAGIVRGHRGAIRVSSSPGNGSSFTILFPIAAKAPGIVAVAAQKTSLHGTGTVLVVDDEAAVLELARQSLECYGYTVLVAESGRAAIDIFKQHHSEIAAVLLDLSMPGMSGEEALVELRKLRSAVKVVISSGYSEAETMRFFEAHRVSGFIQKPYTVTRLAEQIKSTLGNFSALTFREFPGA
jgi:PAS domain S-box-containing protein